MGRILEVKISQKEIDELYCNERESKNATIHLSKYGDVIPVRNVSSNENIIKISLDAGMYRKFIQVSVISSPDKGFFVPAVKNGRHLTKEKLKDIVLGYIFDNIDDAIEFIIGKPIAAIETDPYTKNNYLLCNWNGFVESSGYFQLGRVIYIKFDYVDNEGIVTIRTRAKAFYRNDDDVLNHLWYTSYEDYLHKGDNISFLFDDGSIIDFSVKNKPLDKIQFSCPLFQEDIDILLNNRMVSYRITYAKEGVSPRNGNFHNELFGEYMQQAFHFYLLEYINTIKNLFPDYIFPSRKTRVISNNYNFSGCYVYLMRDNTNGYYKIGISNKPEYREKTLQSEKPTIEMIACKKYPTRKIAASIESALHTAYSQQRLRGEWFNLTDADVAAIIETLK